MLYTESDLEASMDKIETINFHEEKDVMGIKFWAYNAGHVLGAAMFMIEIAGVKVCVVIIICSFLIWKKKLFRYFTQGIFLDKKIAI